MIGEVFPLKTMAQRAKAAAAVLTDMSADYMTLHKNYEGEPARVEQPIDYVRQEQAA